MKNVFVFIICFIIGFGYGWHTYSDIPKIIHYVWLGKNPLPESVQTMIRSWQKNAPEYKIMRWDETNCDIQANDYIKWAYDNQLWSYASDWCRLNALYEYGGLYLDTDHELVKNPSKLLDHTRLVFTYQSNVYLSGSFIAATKKHPFIKALKDHYATLTKTTTPIPYHLTKIYYEHFDIPLKGQTYHSKNVSLVPTNIAMIDFGGGENIAIHHYDGTNTKNRNGTYYEYFSTLFLQRMALPVCVNNTKYHLILLDENTGYFYETKQHVKILKKSDTTLHIEKAGKIYPLLLKDNCFSK